MHEALLGQLDIHTDELVGSAFNMQQGAQWANILHKEKDNVIAENGMFEDWCCFFLAGICLAGFIQTRHYMLQTK